MVSATPSMKGRALSAPEEECHMQAVQCSESRRSCVEEALKDREKLIWGTERRNGSTQTRSLAAGMMEIRHGGV